MAKKDKIMLTQKNQLRGITKQGYVALKELCKLSKNMYNVGLYNIRQCYFAEKKYLSYESNYHLCKENENYQLLNTDMAQQTLKVVDRNFKSFFGLISLAKEGKYKFQDIKLPKYLKKDGYFPLVFPRVKVKDGYFNIPMSPSFKRLYGKVSIQLPQRLLDKQIKEIRIHPKFNAKFFEIEYVYIANDTKVSLNSNNALSIDLGVDNLAACVTTKGASFIIDGKRLKSINQWYNKENARLQSIKDKQGIKGLTRKQASLITNRNNQVRDYLNKSAKFIVDYCIKNDIGKIIVGYNPTIKQGVNIGRKNNQSFTQIPLGNLRLKIESLCNRLGVAYVEQEESYTSKASFLDKDNLPIYNADNPQKYTFSGKRISRGQYKSSKGIIINADLNGALNIMVKSKQVANNDVDLLCSGFLAKPLRIRVA